MDILFLTYTYIDLILILQDMTDFLNMKILHQSLQG